MSDPLDSTPARTIDQRAKSGSGISGPKRNRTPSLLFATLAGISLALDLASKSWAERALTRHGPFEATVTVVKDHLWFALAYNKGGAWGLLHDAPDAMRRPFS